jgi:hypothetical protein
MDEPHGNSGRDLPIRSARRAFAAGLATLCALVPVLAQGDEPAGARTLPAAVAGGEGEWRAKPPKAERLPPVEPSEQAGSQVATASYAEPHDLASFLHRPMGQQVSYIAVDSNAAASGNPLTALNQAPGQPLFRFSGMQEPTPPPENESEAAAQSDTQSAEQQTYGQAPTNNALQFLRDVDVLLAPGAWQFDTGFVYTYFANDFPVPLFNPADEVVDVVEGEARQRMLFTPLAFRYGWSTNVQLFANLPVGWAGTQVSRPDFSDSFDVGGLGDLTFGASIHLLDGEDQCPDVIGTVGFTAPTGQFNAPVFGLVPGSNLGQGYWAYNTQLLFIHRYDPVILFYGGGYRHLWERPFDGVLIRPGEQANYMMGVGFSVNDRVTLSTTFQGYYLTNTFIDGEEIAGSNLEPMTLRFAATIVRNCRILEPFVTIGMTDAAPRANLGIVVTFY